MLIYCRPASPKPGRNNLKSPLRQKFGHRPLYIQSGHINLSPSLLPTTQPSRSGEDKAAYEWNEGTSHDLGGGTGEMKGTTREGALGREF